MWHPAPVENIRRTIDGNDVQFTVDLTTPACPLKEVIRKDCEQAVTKELGDGANIQVHFTSTVTTQRSNAPLLPGVKNIVAIASGTGGVGKSTISANLGESPDSTSLSSLIII